MRKEDDSSLLPVELRAVEERARQSLDKAAAWGRFPTPVDDIVSAAKLRVAPKGLFDPERLLAYAKAKTAKAFFAVKTALSKILGLYDASEQIIHIDESVGLSKQKFLTLHETGHHELPAHRKIFTFFQDCEQTLAPDIANQFEREANNFARYALFQGTAYRQLAADCPMGIKSPINLARKFGASNYASAREFARTNHRSCVVYVLEPIEIIAGQSACAAVRRIETSPSFEESFGCPPDVLIDKGHALFPLLPIGRKMTRPTALVYRDKNGDQHECLGEAFDTTHNILLLIYPVKALTAKSIIVPAQYTDSP
ncbi:ImmA/IrrE family metallo-endopeptidase [Variovorax sp. GB1P17]|uniref:ImmA/IrrE family metallo-endopeptidase n=1 Tax=Variovorax sp. GB1P17 TaxID=3443740 RepID=UPI003F465EAB